MPRCATSSQIRAGGAEDAQRRASAAGLRERLTRVAPRDPCRAVPRDPCLSVRQTLSDACTHQGGTDDLTSQAHGEGGGQRKLRGGASAAGVRPAGGGASACCSLCAAATPSPPPAPPPLQHSKSLFNSPTTFEKKIKKENSPGSVHSKSACPPHPCFQIEPQHVPRSCRTEKTVEGRATDAMTATQGTSAFINIQGCSVNHRARTEEPCWVAPHVLTT